MTDSTLVPTKSRASRPSLLTGIAQKSILARLQRIEDGAFRIVATDIDRVVGSRNDGRSAIPTLVVHDPRFWLRIARGGTVAAGATFAEGMWSSDDVVAIIRCLVRNRHVMLNLNRGLARVSRPLLHGLHWLNRNTRAGSRRNIAAHYDLGNDFFEAFLDPTMTYSSAWFESDDAPLERAQVEKLDRLCRKLELGPDDHVCEIGTGWGSFAMHAAGRYGCRVTTTTISKEQLRLAKERIAAAGLSDRIDVVFCDYRDLVEKFGAHRFDKLVSIEMIEAVGHANLGTYLAQCAKLLKPGGVMGLQAITIADQVHDQALRSVDFIQRYIFPGSYIPSVASISRGVGRSTDFRIDALEDFGMHYAVTLQHWRHRLLRAKPELRARGYEDWLLRLYEFYFAYCEGGFRERQIGVSQIVLSR